MKSTNNERNGSIQTGDIVKGLLALFGVMLIVVLGIRLIN